ncbi:serine/threonine protein kinase [Methylobacterium sp. ID0610]|uniref:serine/threonine protein kinase n=1 Tax=Methylobacterium carpenticola TaxID=3344827 RepID=UPI0036C767DD
MRSVALACLGLLGFAAAALPPAVSLAQAPPAAPPPQIETTQAAPPPVTAPAPPAAAPAPRGDGRGAGRAKRRISYAACNRAALRRNLKGGARRRFLIRCRLGYERIQPGNPARTRP